MNVAEFRPGDQVLVAGTVTHLGGNFLVISFPQTNSIQAETTNVIAYKQNVTKLTQMVKPIYMLYQPVSGGVKHVKLLSAATCGMMEEILDENDKKQCKLPYIWLQNLASTKVKAIDPQPNSKEIDNVGSDKKYLQSPS